MGGGGRIMDVLDSVVIGLQLPPNSLDLLIHCRKDKDGAKKAPDAKAGSDLCFPYLGCC